MNNNKLHLKEQKRVFDTSSIKGLKQAERFQNALYKKFDCVSVRPIGLDKVAVMGNNLCLKKSKK